MLCSIICNMRVLRSQEMSILSMAHYIQSLLKPVPCLPIIFRLLLSGFGLFFLYFKHNILWLDPLWQFPDTAAAIFVMSCAESIPSFSSLFSCPFFPALLIRLQCSWAGWIHPWEALLVQLMWLFFSSSIIRPVRLICPTTWDKKGSTSDFCK